MTRVSVRFFNLSEPVMPMFRDLVPALIERGHPVEVVISRSSYRKGAGPDELRAAVPGVSVRSAIGPPSQLNLAVGWRAMAMVLYWLHAAMILLVGRRATLNVFLTAPPGFFGLGIRIARLRRQHTVVVVMDVHPQEFVAFGTASADAPHIRLLEWLTSSALRLADHVVVIGRCMRDRIQDRGVPAERITVIPNWVDDTTILPLSVIDNDARSALGWEADEIVVMYGGNVGHAQLFDDFVVAATELTGEKVRVVVVGDGTRAEAIRMQLERTGAGEYHTLLHDRFPLGVVLSAADVHFISLKADCTGLGVPSKTYAALASGRPIIYQGLPTGEIARTVTEHGVGTVVSPGDSAALVATIRAYASNADRRREEGRRARRTLEAHYTKEHGVSRYLAVIEPFLDSQSGGYPST